LSTLPFTIPRLDRSRIVLTVMFALLLVASMSVAGSSLAQDAASTDGHPLVGTWIIPANGDDPAIASFSSDGTMIDIEASGEIGLGSWSATSDTGAIATFVIFFDQEDLGGISSLIVRVTLEYDEMTGSATANYTITLVSLDGTVLYADSGSGVAIRLAVEAPDMIGTPIPGLVIPSDEMSDAA